MKKLQEVNRELDDRIQDEKMYKGGLADAGKDDEFAIQVNPMVVKFKDLESQLREYKETTGYYAAEAKKQNAAINSLEGERSKLNVAIRTLKQQLLEQRNRIQAQKKLREMQSAQAEVVRAEVIQMQSNPSINLDDVVDDVEDGDTSEEDLGRETI
mmetsp:Transcript_10157/g.18515  ORF Transcript_10157/g.18515 Transcript_10157/m.18515 type:complete len:156 (+) Transcript_10157:11244-11711(+)